MIRDITHNKKERKESVMMIVESDIELYTIFQGSGESLDVYYKVFKAQVDTIDAHGGNAGYHPVVYALHLAALLDKKGIAKEVYNGMEETEKKAMQNEAMKSAKEAYLAYLFILMADDERYGGVKTALGDNYLLGQQEYPQDLLAAKRLLADFKGVPSKVKNAAEAADEQRVAFAEDGMGGEYIPTCYGCGRKYKGGWRKCSHITDDHRAKVAALDAAGHFRHGNNNNNNNNKKKGAVNLAAGAGKDDDDDKSKDDATKT